MRVIALAYLERFWLRHPDAQSPLRALYRVASIKSWRHLPDVKKDFPKADAVETEWGTATVFNIGGNKYRLIARIKYRWGLLNIKGVLTHTEYDKDLWKRRTWRPHP